MIPCRISSNTLNSGQYFFLYLMFPHGHSLQVSWTFFFFRGSWPLCRKEKKLRCKFNAIGVFIQHRFTATYLSCTLVQFAWREYPAPKWWLVCHGAAQCLVLLTPAWGWKVWASPDPELEQAWAECLGHSARRWGGYWLSWKEVIGSNMWEEDE